MRVRAGTGDSADDGHCFRRVFPSTGAPPAHIVHPSPHETMRSLVRTLPLVVLAAAVAACSSSSGDDAARRAIAPDVQPVTITRLRAEPYSFAYNSGYTNAARVVARDAEAWRLAWERIHARTSPVPDLPAFDPAEEQMVVVALGQRNSGGYSILVDSARAAGGQVEVFVTSIAPGPACGTTAALSEPVDVARMPRSALPVVFRERAITSDCR